jgi:branched-subunit amino acid permease
MAVPVLQVTFSVVIALFLLQIVRRVLGNQSNGLAQGVAGGLDFLLAS